MIGVRMKQNCKKNKVENKESFGYTLNKRSPSGRELSLPCSKRTCGRHVPPEVNRSTNVNRVLSCEDSYKATLERNRLHNYSQKEVLSMYYVGIDWADDHHDVFITDDSAVKIDAFTIPHNAEGVYSLQEKLLKLTASKEQVLIALETPKNLLVFSLLDKGYTVYSFNPKAVDRYRDRYRVSGARDDSFDAMVIANILRTDRHQFRPIVPDSMLLRELKILTHDQQHLIRLKTKLINQIQSCLKDYYPVALQFFTEIDQDITIDFLLEHPTAQAISVKKLTKFLKEHHYPKPEDKAKEIYSALTTSQMFVEEYVIRAKSRFLVTLLNQLQPLKAQIIEYQREIDNLFEQHPDKDIFKSLPGSGQKNAPRLLAEMGDNKERYLEARDVQCEAGTAPITDKSGKIKIVKIRFACRKFFRNTMYQFAFSSLKQSLWARNFYNSQRTTGKTHTQALRALGNKWLKIIFHLWKNNLHYDENRHLADIMRQQLTVVATA